MMFRALAYIAVLLLITGCGNYRPLYGPTADGQDVSSVLSTVSVAEQKSRTGQLIRNEFVANSIQDSAKYELKLTISENTGGVSATPGTVVYRKRFNLSVQYELVDLVQSKSVANGRSFANVSFDTIREPIADLQAAESARSRAASQVGQDLKQRVAAYFASSKMN